MGNDKNCSTCRYHDEGMCYCPKANLPCSAAVKNFPPKSNEFRDVTADTHHCRKYRRDWEQAMTEAFMKGARR